MSFLTAEYDYDMDIKVNRQEAFEDGVDLTAISCIKNIMKSLDCDVNKAMELVGTPDDKKEEYKNRIESDK